MHKVSLYWQRAFENCMLWLFVVPNTRDSVFSEDCAQREKKLCVLVIEKQSKVLQLCLLPFWSSWHLQTVLTYTLNTHTIPCRTAIEVRWNVNKTLGTASAYSNHSINDSSYYQLANFLMSLAINVTGTVQSYHLYLLSYHKLKCNKCLCSYSYKYERPS